MKKYIRSSTDDSKYIGGKLWDIVDQVGYPDDSPEAKQVWYNRYETMDNALTSLTSGSCIIYRPDSQYNIFGLTDNYDGLLADISEGMAIKSGIDMCDIGNAFKLIGYYGSYEDIVYIYPINSGKADKLYELIEDADFSESIVIENEIAQQTWNGASVEDVLKSWA